MAMPRDTLRGCHIETGHWQATFHGICVKHRQTYGIANTGEETMMGSGGNP
jgi:hypothetical protein